MTEGNWGMQEMKDETRKAENKTRIRDCLKKRGVLEGSYTGRGGTGFSDYFVCAGGAFNPGILCA